MMTAAPLENTQGTAETGRPPYFNARSMLMLYFVICVLLPTGSIFGVNVKIAIFLATTVIIVARPRDFGTSSNVWLGVAGVIGFLSIWLFIGQIRSNADISLGLSQFKDILVTMATAYLVSMYIVDRASLSRLLVVVINSVTLLALLKLAIFFYCLSTGTATVDVIDRISAVFGTNLMTIQEDDVISRIQFNSDTIVPACLYAMLVFPGRLRYGRLRSTLIFGLLVFSLLFSFSRFLWAYGAIAVLIGMVSSRFDKTKAVYVVLALLTALYFNNELGLVYELRTSDRFTSASDGPRDEQREALVDFFVSAPVVGHGLGSYAPTVIRDEKLKYSYELQLLALLGQLGLAGCSLLLLVTVVYYWPALKWSLTTLALWGPLALLVTFLASGLFNPLLTSSSAGVGYGFFFALFRFVLSQQQAFTASPRPTNVRVKLTGGKINAADIGTVF